MKACLNNDFSFYKRAFGFLRSSFAGSDQQAEENQRLHLFLANNSSIMTNLKTSLQKISGQDEVMGQIIVYAANVFEENRFLLPKEKHALLRVMPFGLFLMDSDGLNVFKSKKLKLERFAKLFKRAQIVPICGDMQIGTEQIIKSCPNSKDDKEFHLRSEDRKWAKTEYAIVNHINQCRVAQNDYLCRLSMLMSDIKASIAREGKLSSRLSSDTATIVYQGFQLISGWTARVLEQSAYKYANAATPPQAPEDASSYEMAVRYNYTPDEYAALVEMISLIKGVQSVLKRHEATLVPILRSYVHSRTQEFLQIAVRDMIRSMTKKKKQSIRDLLMLLRTIGSDWADGVEADKDPALAGKKYEKPFSPPDRIVPTTPTQLHIMRSIVRDLFSNATTSGIFADKDFKPEQAQALEQFYADSARFEPLITFSETLRQAGDLGDLWYREFYLEITKRIQFPIEQSLPWILTDFVVNSKHAVLSDCMLYPLDLYNDAAHRAMHQQYQQFLFDEIEAEVNLAFDQLIFKLSTQVFAHFKSIAASIILDKNFKKGVEDFIPSSRFSVVRGRYDGILAQRHFQLLGRSIDLKILLSQRINRFFRESLDIAISRFEASDLTAIVELDMLIENTRLAHQLLSQHLPLDPFETILADANESLSLVVFHGRIALHVIYELVSDVMPNFCYNSVTQRFIRTPVSFAEDVKRENAPKMPPEYAFGSKNFSTVFQAIADLHRYHIGAAHIQSLVRVVGPARLPLVISETLQSINLRVSGSLVACFRTLAEGMPPSIKLPIIDYGAEGAFGYFLLQTKAIAEYPDLRPEVFQNIREFGNGLIIMSLLDTAMSQADLFTFMNSAPFLGLDSEDSVVANPAPIVSTMTQISQVLASNPGVKAPAELAQFPALAQRNTEIYAPHPRTSFFGNVLDRFKSFVAPFANEWKANLTSKDLFPIDGTKEFYRMWSALQFVFCLPPMIPKMPSDLELFGDGLIYGGMSIVYFLGQAHRFDVFDFSYHVRNVCQIVPPADQKNAQLMTLLQNIAWLRDLNFSIVALLKAHTDFQLDAVFAFHPPKHEYVEQHHVVSLDEPKPKAPAPPAGPPPAGAAKPPPGPPPGGPPPGPPPGGPPPGPPPSSRPGPPPPGPPPGMAPPPGPPPVGPPPGMAPPPGPPPGGPPPPGPPPPGPPPPGPPPGMAPPPGPPPPFGAPPPGMPPPPFGAPPPGPPPGMPPPPGPPPGGFMPPPPPPR
eukprot:TRINITY_DN2288_c0_g1_i2.p1 TRINITY_DN2288_c0_g1~~TRINITY_DN2288_c0_g1_i2.p1  ORF type:complete len:1415 (+),score=362.60 TRINITY_DN2288_c0_g1_i2:563-4246(+)